LKYRDGRSNRRMFNTLSFYNLELNYINMKNQAVVKYYNLNEVLVVEISGTYYQRYSEKDFKEFIRHVKNSDQEKILIDYTNCEIHLDTLCSYSRQNQVAEIYNNIYRRMASVIPKCDEQVMFFISLLKNRGIVLENFKTREEAMFWLENN